MAPHLDSCCFAKLSSSKKKDNLGTVTGTGFRENDPVKIRSRTSSKTWGGHVIDRVSGNTWNAVVRRDDRDDERLTETVGVTVTNSGVESNEVRQESEIVD